MPDNATSCGKKIAIVTGSLGMGGLEKVVALCAKHFSSRGCEVRIYTLLQNRTKSFQSIPSNVECIHFTSSKSLYEKKWRFIFKWIGFLKKEFRSFDPDAIFAMTFKIGSLCCLSGCGNARKVIVREINDPLGPGRSKAKNLLFEFFCRHAKGFVFQTEYEKSCFGSSTRKRSTVIPNPCDAASEAPSSFDGRIVSTGRLDNRQKRYDVMLRGFDLFAESNQTSSLHIYGSGADEAQIRDFASKCKHADRIVFEGQTKNVAEKIRGASCFVLTSDFEGMSNSLLEAYLGGVPCLTSDWPGYDSIVSDGVNGLVYERQDAKQLSEKLLQIITDPGLAKRFSEKGIADRGKFDSKKVLDDYLNFVVKAF